MSSIAYEAVRGAFLGYVNANQLLSKELKLAEVFMDDYLHKACAKPNVRRLFSEFSMDDDLKEIEFEMRNPTDDDSDEVFLIDILSLGMVIAWLSPKVRSDVNIAQMFAGKEQKFYSQASHIAELRTLLSDAQTEQRMLIRDRGLFFNTYLEDE